MSNYVDEWKDNVDEWEEKLESMLRNEAYSRCHLFLESLLDTIRETGCVTGSQICAIEDIEDSTWQ